MFRFCNKYSGEALSLFFSCSQGCLAGCVLVGRRRHHFHSLAHPGQDGTLGRDLPRQREHPGFSDDISTNVSYYHVPYFTCATSCKEKELEPVGPPMDSINPGLLQCADSNWIAKIAETDPR